MFSTINSVKEYTGYDVTLDLIKRAQGLIEIFIGKDEIDIDPQPRGVYWGSRKIAPFTVQKIEKDFSIILSRNSYNTKDYDEILDLVKSKVDSGSGYNAEVYGIENRQVNPDDRPTGFHEFYIKIKP